jgi:hypothetical protein
VYDGYGVMLAGDTEPGASLRERTSPARLNGYCDVAAG